MDRNEKLLKMRENLEKLQSKKNDLNNKLENTEEKIKQQESEISQFIEETKVQMLKSLVGKNLSLEDVQVLETANTQISAIFKMLLGTKNISGFADKIYEFCKTIEPKENYIEDGEIK